MKEFLLRLRSSQYRNLSTTLALLALGIPIGIIIVGRPLTATNDVLFSILVHLSFIIMFSLGACIGLLAVIRKEFRQVVTIRGRVAQIFGVLLFMMSTIIVLYGIIHLVLTF